MDLSIRIFSFRLNSNKNSKEYKTFQKIKKRYCHDEGFKEGYGCRKNLWLKNKRLEILEGTPDGYIIALEKNTNEVCGFIEWSFWNKGIWLRIISSKAHSDRTLYKGIGSKMMKKLFSLAKKLKMKYIMNQSDAHQFYFKIGYKHIGTTGWFVKKILQNPSINEIRTFENMAIIRAVQSGDQKLIKDMLLNFTYKEDNKNKWLDEYGPSYEDAYTHILSNTRKDDQNLIKPFLQKKYFLIYSKNQMNKIKKFPKIYYST